MLILLNIVSSYIILFPGTLRCNFILLSKRRGMYILHYFIKSAKLKILREKIVGKEITNIKIIFFLKFFSFKTRAHKCYVKRKF